MLMNDDDRDGQQAGKKAGPENPAGKEPGEFTRLFLAGQSGQVSPTPETRAETPGTNSSPGEFTSLFATQDQGDLAATKGGGDELVAEQPAIETLQPSTMPSFSATGEFTKLVGGPSPIAEPSSSKQNKSLTDEFPRQESVQANSASPSLGVGRAVEPGPVSQEILEEAFRHPLAPRAVEPLNLKPNNASRQDDPKPRGFTQLFNAAPASAPAPGSLNTGNVPRVEVRGAPSDFTRVVRSSEVRQALEKPASQPTSSSPGPQGIPPAIPQLQPPVLQYQPPQMPQPEYAPPQMPAQPAMLYPVPVPQVYSPQMPQPPQVPGLQMPGLQPPVAPQADASAGSKWVAYLPILIVINVLFMVAVLLILFFALRK